MLAYFVDFPFNEEMFVEPINIGEDWEGLDPKWRKILESKRLAALKENKANAELDKQIMFEKCEFRLLHILGSLLFFIVSTLFPDEIPYDDINHVYSTEYLPYDTFVAAKHYGLYRDLFNRAYFIPVANLQVAFEVDGKESELLLPACRGNEIYPSQVFPYFAPV